MRRGAALILTLIALGGPPPAAATHNADDHSANVHPVASLKLGAGLSDVAFWGELAVVGQFVFQDGSTDGFSVLDVTDATRPREITRFRCTGAGWDVSIWEDLVFLSADNFTPSQDGTCASEPGSGFQGIKIVSIADPAHPQYVASVPMECSGSHDNTVVPDLVNNRLIVYAAALKYPYDPPALGCDHIIEVPLSDPSKAKSIGSLPNDQAESCHDITVYLPKRLLAGACQNELRLYDITDLAAPELLSVTTNPSVIFQHSAAFTNDGNGLVSGEEGATYENISGAPTASCPGNGATIGALWFYDISNPMVLVPRGYHQISRAFELQSPNGAGCSAHNFNVVPSDEDRDLLSAAWYGAGFNVLDFTDLSAPQEVAYYQPAPADPEQRAHYWAAYFYRGYVYATNTYESKRGTLDVYRVDDPQMATAYRLGHLNPQTQEALVEAPVVSPAAPPAQPAAPRAACSTRAVRVRVPRRARSVRAYLVRGLSKRRLRVRRRVVSVSPAKLAAGAYAVRVSYRVGKRRRTVVRRVIGCG